MTLDELRVLKSAVTEAEADVEEALRAKEQAVVDGRYVDYRTHRDWIIDVGRREQSKTRIAYQTACVAYVDGLLTSKTTETFDEPGHRS